MIKRLKLTSLALFALAFAHIFIAEGARAQQNQPFKNVQVLKDLSPEQVLLLMGGYNLALGRNCDFCHDMAAMEKGEKPEHKTALQMIKMTRDINAAVKDTYKLRVDCMSCHQGKAKPPLPASPVVEGQTDETPKPPPLPTPKDDIFFRATALGATQVAFPHAKHMARIDCAKCHHTGDNSKCGNCHKHNAGDRALAFKLISHSASNERACAGCHLTMKVGPTRCAECHRK
jgi:hypothetical protein